MKKICALLCLLLLFACLTPGWAEETGAPFEEAAEETALYLASGQEPVWTDNSYQSENIAITITAQRYENTDVYVADIHVKNVRSFQRAYPGKKWGKTAERITTFSQKQSAILSMTGDSANNFSAGWVIMNGTVLRSKVNRKRDMGILYTTGEMVTIPAQEIDNNAIQQAVEAGEIWQTFLFGPMLLDADGKAMTKFNSNVGPVNPRSVIGYYEPGHYCFVQVDGRRTPSALEKGRKNAGLKLTDLSAFMESMGCKAAYNLDGGQSSLMYFNGKIHSSPFKNGRRLSDIVLIREVE